LKNRYLYFLILVFALLAASMQDVSAVISEDEVKSEKTEKEFDAAPFIMEHVADSHEWHILTKKDGTDVAVYLPVIIYDRESGFHLFSSRKIAHGHSYKNFTVAHEGKYAGKIVKVDEHGQHDGSKPPL